MRNLTGTSLTIAVSARIMHPQLMRRDEVVMVHFHTEVVDRDGAFDVLRASDHHIPGCRSNRIPWFQSFRFRPATALTPERMFSRDFDSFGTGQNFVVAFGFAAQ